MKVIDLLNKIAKGEIPNRILYDHYIWSWTGDDYRTEIDGKEQFLITGMYYTWFTEFIKEEVEIIEEDKKIEKLESYISCGWCGTCKDLDREDLFNDLKKIGTKINKLIDEVNKLKEGKE